MTRAIPQQNMWQLGLVLCVAAAGCGSVESIEPDADGCDAGPVCVGALDLDMGDSPPPDAFDSATRANEAGEACFDGQDNDGNEAVDCDEPACVSAYRSCCVGRAIAQCCSAPTTAAALDFDRCTGMLGGACGSAGVTPFGSPMPTLYDGVLFPNGDRSYDSGVVVDAPIAPGRAIEVRATLAIPSAICTDGCVEAVGVGLTAQASYGGTSYVRPLVGLLISASRRMADLVIDGERAGRVALRDGETTLDITLTLSPDGAVHVDGLVGGALSGRVTRSGALRLVAWGHNMNSTTRDGARVMALSASTSICDAPATWTERAPLLLGDGAMTRPSALLAPSVADSATESRLVFEAAGRIVLARRALSASTYALVGGYENAALADPGGAVLRDPELVALADGSWRVYVATEAGAIAFADGVADGDLFTLREVAVAPLALGAAITRLDGPTVLAPSGTDAAWHMVVRALDSAGQSALVHLVSSDGRSFALPASATLESATLRVPQASFGAFDRDELAAPDLFRHAGSIGIAYAGRAGARWSIGLLVTDDFRYTRPAPVAALLGDGAVLSASALTTDLDALSVSDPDVVVRGGQVELFYAGSNGVRIGLARTARPSSEGI